MLHKIFDKNLVAIRKSRITLTLSKPGYIGMCILGISKVLMCQFPYDYIKNKHGNNLRLLFADTNNLMFAIKTTDRYENFNSNKEMFDLTYYSTKSKLLQKLTNDKIVIKLSLTAIKLKECVIEQSILMTLL